MVSMGVFGKTLRNYSLKGYSFVMRMYVIWILKKNHNKIHITPLDHLTPLKNLVA
jgi:hypothetical protein